MTQNSTDDSSFTVQSGETVTVSLQSIQCNCNTSAGFDGQGLAKQHRIPDIYGFGVAGNCGDEKVFAALCQFLPDDPLTSHYTIRVSGSAGGDFSSSSIYKETPDASFQLYFSVA
jgi:hypothetical protein